METKDRRPHENEHPLKMMTSKTKTLTKTKTSKMKIVARSCKQEVETRSIFCSFVGAGGITMAQQPHFQALRSRLNVRIRDHHKGVNTTGQFQSILVY